MSEISQPEFSQVGFFHALYLTGDNLGAFLAFIAEFPAIFGFSLFFLIIFRRDIFSILWFTGLVINELLNKVLKRIFKEGRPIVFPVFGCSLNGMPSNHSQFILFFLSFLTLFICVRLKGKSYSDFGKKFILFSSLIISILNLYGRIYLRYHTKLQVLVGASIGLITGSLWFLFVHFIMTPNFPKICNSSIGKYLLLRDLSSIDNIFLHEYETVNVKLTRGKKLKAISKTK